MSFDNDDPPIQPDEVFLEGINLGAIGDKEVGPDFKGSLQELGAVILQLDDYFSLSHEEQKLRKAATPSRFVTGYNVLCLLVGAYIADTPNATGEVNVRGIIAGSLLSGLSVYQLAKTRLTSPRLDETLPVHASDKWRRLYLKGNKIPPPTHYVRGGVTYNLANEQRFPKPSSN